MKTAYFTLQNLDCAHCAAKIEQRLNALPEVSEAVVTFPACRLQLTAEDPLALLPTVQREVTALEPPVRVLPEAQGRPHKHEHEQGRADWIGMAVGVALFAAALLYAHIGTPLPLLSAGLFLLAYAVLGGEVVANAVKSLLHGDWFNEEFLMTIATVGAFVIGEYDEAVGVMLFFRVGEWLEHRAVARSRSAVMDAVDMRPETVCRVENGTVTVIPATEAAVGDRLLLRAGDRVPLDGVVVEGDSRLDTSPVTGEPQPVHVKAGDRVLSGCINLNGTLTIQAENRLEDSMVTRILQSVENAAAGKPKMDRFITRFSRVYTPAVVIAAVLLAVIPSLITGDWHRWVYTALNFLVISCPCALVLSVPLAFFAGIGAGARQSILFKSGSALEALNQVRAVVMDKTGTVTRGRFALAACEPADGMDGDRLLRLCASAEAVSTHPVAVSIAEAARAASLELLPVETVEEIAGNGVRATLADGELLCGNRRLLARYGVEVPTEQACAGTEVLAALNGVYIGRLSIADTIKPDAAEAVAAMRRGGLHTALLTGDTEDGANAVAAALHIDEVHARLLPQDKLTRLQQIRADKGAVLFVGDGINDAPVLAGADVGAAMGSGADAAMEAADVVFMTNNVNAIPQAISLARRVSRIARQNVAFALAVKAAVLLLGLLGMGSMWLAVFADSGVAMLCVLNAVRLLWKKT